MSEPGVEFLYVIYEVGGASSPNDTFQRHSGHEWGYVISGELKVTIGFRDHVLEAGRLDLPRLVDPAPPGEHGRHAGARYLVRDGTRRPRRRGPGGGFGARLPMRWLELHAWWGLLATALLIAVFGVTDVVSGAAADRAIPLGLTGMTIEELEAEGPTAYRLFDTQVNGIGLALIGLLFAAVLLFGFRQNLRWAWWTMWLLPAWAVSILVFYLVVGVQPDQAPPPPMVSGRSWRSCVPRSCWSAHRAS